MRKKLIALLLAAITTVSLLSGCGADSGVMDTANANAVAGGNSDLPVVTWKMGVHLGCRQRPLHCGSALQRNPQPAHRRSLYRD